MAAGSATLAARELELDTKPDAPAEVVVKLEMPPTKDGGVFQTRLTVSAVETGARKPAAVFEADVWVFPKKPFIDRTQWLKSLKISLYDPKGDTARLFILADIPFDAPLDLDSLAKVTEGVVIVGEGVAFKDEKGLDAALHKLAAGGRSVLCLAPSAGTIGIPSLDGLTGSERELTFRRDVVKLLDKRLSPDGWPTDEKVIASTFVVKGGEEGKSVGEVTANATGWQWSEVRFAGGGHWAVCGAAIVTRWDDWTGAGVPNSMANHPFRRPTGPRRSQLPEVLAEHDVSRAVNVVGDEQGRHDFPGGGNKFSQHHQSVLQFALRSCRRVGTQGGMPARRSTR